MPTSTRSLFFDPAAAAAATTAAIAVAAPSLAAAPVSSAAAPPPPGGSDPSRVEAAAAAAAAAAPTRRPIAQSICKRTRSKSHERTSSSSSSSDADDDLLAPAKRRRRQRTVAKEDGPPPPPSPPQPPQPQPPAGDDDGDDEAANALITLLRERVPANDDDDRGRVANEVPEGNGNPPDATYTLPTRGGSPSSSSGESIEEAEKPRHGIGALVGKVFEGHDGELRPFAGAVERYDEEYDPHKIVCEDGDAEELTYEEVSSIIFAEKRDDASAGPREASPPSADRPPAGVRSREEEEEVTWLRRELETMRSERDLAVIELAHLETRYDAVIEERNDLLARRRRAEEEEEEEEDASSAEGPSTLLLRGVASGESSAGMRGAGRGEAGATISEEERIAVRAGDEEDLEPGSAEAGAHRGRAGPAVAGGCRGGSSIDAIPAAEAERGDALLVVARLRAEIESSNRRLSEAADRIASLSEEKVALVTRIACALGHHDVAETLRAKDDALDKARSTIAALRAGIGDFDDSPSSSAAAAIRSTAGSNNNARKVSLEGAKSLLSGIAMTRGEKKVPSFNTDGTRTNDVSKSPRSRREPNNIRPKSAMIKPRDSSSSSSIGSGRSSIGSGRVRFDRGTSFDRCAKLPKFDLFASPAHGKENFAKRRKRPVKSSFGGGADADADADADGGSPSTHTAEGSSCEGSIGGRRRKKHCSGGSGGGNGKSKSFSSGGFHNDGGFL